MKRIAYFIAGAVLTGLVLVGFNAARATLPAPGIIGPSLGDNNTNIYTLWQAVTTGNLFNYSSVLSVSQTSGQANCTNMTAAINPITTSASTGYVCLPTAVAGREIYIANGTNQTIDVYSNATSVIVGTTDTINGTAGTTPYTSLTGNKNLQCFAAPANSTTGVGGGAWYCTAGS